MATIKGLLSLFFRSGGPAPRFVQYVATIPTSSWIAVVPGDTWNVGIAGSRWTTGNLGIHWSAGRPTSSNWIGSNASGG